MSKNLKKGLYKKNELKLYELSDTEIEIILEYQIKLPVLQQDNSVWINSRDLYEQLLVGRDYTTWIKKQLEDLDAKDNEDYKLTFTFKGERKNVKVSDYLVTVDFAKDIAMTAGSKGGRTGVKLKEISKLVRRYFKIMEKAAKYRIEWNKDRNQTILMFYGLTEQLKQKEHKLSSYIPEKLRGYYNVYSFEMDLLNQIIIGMRSKEYRKIHKLKDREPIRNSFSELQLEIVHKLEEYDALLIEVQDIYDYEERIRMCKAYFDRKFKHLFAVAS